MHSAAQRCRSGIGTRHRRRYRSDTVSDAVTIPLRCRCAAECTTVSELSDESVKPPLDCLKPRLLRMFFRNNTQKTWNKNICFRIQTVSCRKMFLCFCFKSRHVLTRKKFRILAIVDAITARKHHYLRLRNFNIYQVAINNFFRMSEAGFWRIGCMKKRCARSVVVKKWNKPFPSLPRGECFPSVAENKNIVYENKNVYSHAPMFHVFCVMFRKNSRRRRGFTWNVRFAPRLRADQCCQLV